VWIIQPGNAGRCQLVSGQLIPQLVAPIASSHIIDLAWESFFLRVCLPA
jgi:hypothetical protein